ncbi:hypothetical protein [Marichromatium bheemlicum]|uniref:Uncharacterized protein n=1 Tax=Marichromatium bheemlicum TaxID=365339 RepID=A0ABX1IA90_9GAMM|nr:hypothetical protein [Marichromatium bheemlicum]NKN33117.1 hypothetical protein [Marichromatium bheemlicum]
MTEADSGRLAGSQSSGRLPEAPTAYHAASGSSCEQLAATSAMASSRTTGTEARSIDLE